MRPFHPPPWLRNRHLQSILGSLPPQAWLIRRGARALLAASSEMILDCGAGVRLQAFHAAPPGPRAHDPQRLAVLLHGWEGSADSSYVLSCAALLFRHGYAVARLNLRDHGATHALNRGLFHSCRLPEVQGAVRALSARWPEAQIYLSGFSLGGNFMLRVAAQRESLAALRGVVAISPVLDPEATLSALERGLALYRRYFVKRWSRSLRTKQRAWPQVHDFDQLLRLQALRPMTAGLVECCTEFPSLAAYLDGYALTGARLASLTVPARILIAADDPIIPVADLQHLAQSRWLQVERTQQGGHCGFMAQWGTPSYADRYVLEQFEQFEQFERLSR